MLFIIQAVLTCHHTDEVIKVWDKHSCTSSITFKPLFYIYFASRISLGEFLCGDQMVKYPNRKLNEFLSLDDRFIREGRAYSWKRALAARVCREVWGHPPRQNKTSSSQKCPHPPSPSSAVPVRFMETSSRTVHLSNFPPWFDYSSFSTLLIIV